LGIKVQGPGSGRDTAVKLVGAIEGIRVIWFKDITPFHIMVVVLLKSVECNISSSLRLFYLKLI